MVGRGVGVGPGVNVGAGVAVGFGVHVGPGVLVAVGVLRRCWRECVGVWRRAYCQCDFGEACWSRSASAAGHDRALALNTTVLRLAIVLCRT